MSSAPSVPTPRRESKEAEEREEEGRFDTSMGLPGPNVYTLGDPRNGLTAVWGPPTLVIALENLSQTIYRDTFDPSIGVLAVAFSRDGRWIAATLSDRNIILYEVTRSGMGATVEVKKQLTGQRKAPTAAFTSNHLIVGYGSGDIAAFTIPDLEPTEDVILGHLSSVTAIDSFMVGDKEKLVTSDVDEKIRVSSYPDCHNIESYCLGHRSYVAGVRALPNSRLISAGGDGSVRLWEGSSGAELGRVNLPAAPAPQSMSKDTTTLVSAIEVSFDSTLAAVVVGKNIVVLNIGDKTLTVKDTHTEEGDINGIAFNNQNTVYGIVDSCKLIHHPHGQYPDMFVNKNDSWTEMGTIVANSEVKNTGIAHIQHFDVHNCVRSEDRRRKYDGENCGNVVVPRGEKNKRNKVDAPN